MPWISQNSEIKSITESFWGVGDRFILTDLVIIYTRLGTIQPPVFLKNNNYYFTNQGDVSHQKKNVTDKGLDLFIKYLLRLKIFLRHYPKYKNFWHIPTQTQQEDDNSNL